MALYGILPNVIGVCETKLNENSNFNPLFLNGYTFHFVNSVSNVGGVRLYVKKIINIFTQIRSYFN